MEQNRNALVPAGAEYDSATGTFKTPLPAREGTELAPFDPVALRPRIDGWTPARQRAFIEELSDCGIVGEAAARVPTGRDQPAVRGAAWAQGSGGSSEAT